MNLLSKIIFRIYSLFEKDHEKWVRLLVFLNNIKRYAKKEADPIVFFDLDGRTYGCGLADRLRGMISSYAYAKAVNLPFMIRHDTPFLLEDYLCPNKVDWRYDETRVTYKNSDVFVNLQGHHDVDYILYHDCSRQIHLYSYHSFLDAINSHFNKSYSYGDLFNELFQPSQRLQEKLDGCRKHLGNDYVSISFRFLNLLGDFPDGNNVILSTSEQERLINACLNEIDKIKQMNPDYCSFLVTADSMSFINKAKGIENIYVIPGTTGHSGTCKDKDSILKTMLDFLMIANANKVYLCKEKRMYNSQFSASAAQIYSKPFFKIEF